MMTEQLELTMAEFEQLRQSADRTQAADCGQSNQVEFATLLRLGLLEVVSGQQIVTVQGLRFLKTAIGQGSLVVGRAEVNPTA